MRALRGKSAIVTGASRGIGAGIARRLASEGVAVTAVARDRDALGRLSAEVEVAAGSLVARPGDVTDEARVEEIVAEHVARHGGLDILVNNAGIGAFGPLESIRYEDFLRTLETNAGGSFLFLRAVLPVMKRQRDGDIVHIASVVAHRGYPDQSAYSAAKHAVLGLARAAAAEAHPFGVRVRAISPGGVDTEMIADARPDLDRSELMRIEDVVESLVFLLRMSDSGVVDHIALRRRGSPPSF